MGGDFVSTSGGSLTETPWTMEVKEFHYVLMMAWNASYKFLNQLLE